MLLGGSQGQRVQWGWEMKKAMGGWDSHSVQMASLETCMSSFCGGYTQHQTVFARTSFSARTLAAAGAERTQSIPEHLHWCSNQGNALCVSWEGTRRQHHLLVGSSLGQDCFISMKTLSRAAPSCTSLSNLHISLPEAKLSQGSRAIKHRGDAALW